MAETRARSRIEMKLQDARILAFLATRARPVLPEDVAMALKAPRSGAAAALDFLVGCGRVEKRFVWLPSGRRRIGYALPISPSPEEAPRG